MVYWFQITQIKTHVVVSTETAAVEAAKLFNSVTFGTNCLIVRSEAMCILRDIFIVSFCACMPLFDKRVNVG